MQRDSVQGWGLAIRVGGAAVLCGLALALLAKATPGPPTPAGQSAAVADETEAKALDFLEDTELSEADRRATARDISTLCKEGRIQGC